MLHRDIEELWHAGYIVNSKIGSIAGGTYKCNFDVEITMDVLRVLYHVKPDIIVLATGDADFVSLIQEVRKSGVRIEVAAFEETTGADIQLKCSGFIDLSMYYEEYLASQNDAQEGEESVEEQHSDLIQSQEGDLCEDDVRSTEDQEDSKIEAPVLDTIEDMNL